MRCYTSDSSVDSIPQSYPLGDATTGMFFGCLNLEKTPQGRPTIISYYYFPLSGSLSISKSSKSRRYGYFLRLTVQDVQRSLSGWMGHVEWMLSIALKRNRHDMISTLGQHISRKT